jgi:CheY-like chemotaxis protein
MVHDSAHGATHARRRVLIIDDEVLLVRSFCRVLVRDYDVCGVSSAAEAMARIARGDPWDVILCDLHMPEVDGVEFHRWMARSKPELTRRIGFVTGGAFTPQVESFLCSTAAPVLYKPVTPEDLRSFVQELLARATAAARG